MISPKDLIYQFFCQSFTIETSKSWTEKLFKYLRQKKHVIKREYSNRTLSQNALLHKIVSSISDHTGETYDRIKLQGKLDAKGRGYPFEKSLDGKYNLPKSSADVSIVECMYLIDSLVVLATELHCEMSWYDEYLESKNIINNRKQK